MYIYLLHLYTLRMVSKLLFIISRHITFPYPSLETQIALTWFKTVSEIFRIFLTYSRCLHEGIFRIHTNNIPRILVSFLDLLVCMHAC